MLTELPSVNSYVEVEVNVLVTSNDVNKIICQNLFIGYLLSFFLFSGTVYGLGVYFTVDAAFSAGYARVGSSRYRYMYLARVLTGDYARGRPSYKTLPKKAGSRSTDVYDTVVDNTGNPTFFVTFFDNQCYPQYLIVFQ